MVPTYFIDRPNPIVLTRDGRINFLPFDMIPDTIVVNGFKGLVGSDGLSVVPIKELVNLGYLQPNAGTPVAPLRVEGKLLTGKHPKTICLRSSTSSTEFRLLSPLAHIQKVCGCLPTVSITYRYMQWLLWQTHVIAVADAEEGRDTGVWVPLTMILSRIFGLHNQLADKHDRTV